MKYNKKTGLRITSCVQIDTSNTALNDTNLDYSQGANVPQYVSRLVKFFADSDIMYNQIFDPSELEEQEVKEINSKENSDKGIGLLTD